MGRHRQPLPRIVQEAMTVGDFYRLKGTEEPKINTHKIKRVHTV